jgi:hypothetical protein
MLRVVMSAVLLAFAVFVVQYQKSTERTSVWRERPAEAIFVYRAVGGGIESLAWVPHYPGATVENINTSRLAKS